MGNQNTEADEYSLSKQTISYSWSNDVFVSLTNRILSFSFGMSAEGNLGVNEDDIFKPFESFAIRVAYCRCVSKSRRLLLNLNEENSTY